MSNSILILLASLCVAIIALRQILNANLELREFEHDQKMLPQDKFPDGPVFLGSRESSKLAADFLGLCSHAAEKQMLGALNVERAAAPLGSYFRTLVNTPRSLAGVLVLCGLLVTLLNLQGSVGTLGTSFQNLSENQTDQSAASRSVKQIQTAMGEIAARARDAFLQSFGVILAAASVLALSLFLNNRAQRAFRSLMVWANRTHMRALVDRPPVQEAQVEKLNELIAKMAEVAAGMEGLGPALASVGDLGSKLDASSQIVAEAVQKLPDTINASVGELSLGVTRDIGIHLDHQIEYLKKILAIYGDQKNVVTKIQEYLDTMGESTEKTMAALAGLSALPAKVESLAAAVQSSNRSAAKMISAAAQLDTKIDQIPALDLSRIDGIGELVKDLSAEIREFAKTAPGTIAGTVNTKLDRLSAEVHTLSGRDPAAAIARLQRELGELNFDSQKMDNLSAQLDKLLAQEKSHRFLGGFFGRQ